MTRKEAERIAGRVLEGLVSDLLDTFGDDGEDAETTAAPPTCKALCGRPDADWGRVSVPWGSLVSKGNGFCSKACADEGRALNPAAAPDPFFTAREATALGEAMDESMSAAPLPKPKLTVPGFDGTNGGHKYGSGTSDCDYGCGCWAGAFSSGGPDGVDPLGLCPRNPAVAAPTCAVGCGQWRWCSEGCQSASRPLNPPAPKPEEPRCEPWCGRVAMDCPDGVTAWWANTKPDRGYCSKECRDAGKPVSPR